jgi:hypothetical protein
MLTEANPRRGEVIAEIGGQQRTFKFGMNTVSAFSRMHSDEPGDFSTAFNKDPYGALRDMAYQGLMMRASLNDLPEDFSPLTVGEWIDEMDAKDWEKVQAVLLDAMSLGNPNRANLSKAARQK